MPTLPDTDYAIIVQEGPVMVEDNSTYFTNEVTTIIEYLNEEERPFESCKFATFVPKNGSFKGKLHKVPWERVVMIVELES